MTNKCNKEIKQRELTSSSFRKVEAEQPIPLTPFGGQAKTGNINTQYMLGWALGRKDY